MFEFGKTFKKQNIPLIILFLAILSIATFLRTYQHHDWLFFKWDQARDAFLISEAIEKGPQELPLLGPRATKVDDDYLRLGPAYYYFQYLSGVLFNSTKPDAFAYPDLFFSILVIPLLYLFSRLYFSRNISLAITALYSFSFLVIQYSRFSWNPNAVPFFMLLSFYALIKMLQEEKIKNKLAWTATWSFSFAIASQLHFFAAFAMTGTFGLFFLFFLFGLYQKESSKKYSIKNILFFVNNIFSKELFQLTAVFIMVFGIVYTPVFISDIKTGGENTSLFFGAFSQKPADKPLHLKIIRNFREHTQNYHLLVTSFRSKKDDKLPIAVGLIVATIGIISIISELKKPQPFQNKIFPLLCLSWLAAFFFITISVSYQLRPRYFIPVFPLIFLFFGFFWKAIYSRLIAKPKLANKIIFLTFTVPLVLNAYGTYAWFQEQKISQEESIPIDRTLILKKRDGITLAQFEKVANFITTSRKENDHRVVYQATDEYRLPLEYLITKKGFSPEEFISFTSAPDLLGKDEIIIVETVSGGFKSIDKEIKKYIAEKPKEAFQFGQLSVFIIDIKKETLAGVKPKEKKEEIEKRLFWKDIL